MSPERWHRTEPGKYEHPSFGRVWSDNGWWYAEPNSADHGRLPCYTMRDATEYCELASSGKRVGRRGATQ